MREEEDILIATSLGDLKGDILSVDHMGYNTEKEKVMRTMDALEAVVKVK